MRINCRQEIGTCACILNLQSHLFVLFNTKSTVTKFEWNALMGSTKAFRSGSRFRRDWIQNFLHSWAHFWNSFSVIARTCNGFSSTNSPDLLLMYSSWNAVDLPRTIQLQACFQYFSKLESARLHFIHQRGRLFKRRLA